MFFAKTLFSAVLLASTASAHLQMSWPYPLHSTFNPNTPEAAKDYSMTSPLVTDGTYPCKGFINNPSGSPYMDSVVTWTAGSTINVTIAGTVFHGGGSGQFAMSYDQGETWNVIQSNVGGFVLSNDPVDVAIPSSAPSGEALFSWAWFNRQGNREMYQNCAVVTIEGGGSGLTGPTPFVANAGVNECTTTEGVDVVFPELGDNVVYSGDYASSKPTTATGYTGSNCVGPNASSGSSSSSAAETASSTAVASSTAEASSTDVASSTAVESSTAAQPTAVESSSAVASSAVASSVEVESTAAASSTAGASSAVVAIGASSAASAAASSSSPAVGNAAAISSSSETVSSTASAASATKTKTTTCRRRRRRSLPEPEPTSPAEVSNHAAIKRMVDNHKRSKNLAVGLSRH